MVRGTTQHAARLLSVIMALTTMGVTAAEPEKPQSPRDGDPEVLLRGPLHEAFAEQVDQTVKPGPAAPRKPPEPVEEVPPEVKPEGDNLVWIPGYWHWNEERGEFDWISGLWRVTPPGTHWVPGYWTETDGQYRWASGFWTTAAPDQLSYQPPPPESLEAGPSSPSPADNYFWVPGCWMHQMRSYRWRPGYWSPSYDDWVWTPAHNVWTPGGCVYVDGYWDYTFGSRGVLYCPVYFRQHAYRRPGFCFSPLVALNPSEIFLHLFIRPGCSHYYFGDYYGHDHGTRPYVPWYDFQRVGRRYDPFYAHFAAIERHQGIDTISRCHGWHDYFAQHEDRRPPRVFVESRRFPASAARDKVPLARLSDDSLVKAGPEPRFVSLSAQHRRELERRVTDLRQLGERRGKWEADATQKALADPANRRLAETHRPSLQLPPSNKEHGDRQAEHRTAESQTPEKARVQLGTRLSSETSRSERLQDSLQSTAEAQPRKPETHRELRSASGPPKSHVPDIHSTRAKLGDDRQTRPPSQTSRSERPQDLLRRSTEAKADAPKTHRELGSPSRPPQLDAFRVPSTRPKLSDTHAPERKAKPPSLPDAIRSPAATPSRATPRHTSPAVAPSGSNIKVDRRPPRQFQRPAESDAFRPRIGESFGRIPPTAHRGSSPPARSSAIDRFRSGPSHSPETRRPDSEGSRNRHDRK